MASTHITAEIVTGHKANTKFLYVFEEEQFYTRDGDVKLGKNWRCKNRKCSSRVIQINDIEFVKLNTAKPHNHTDSCAQEFVNLQGRQTMRNDAANIHAIASGSRITSSNAIWKNALIK